MIRSSGSSFSAYASTVAMLMAVLLPAAVTLFNVHAEPVKQQWLGKASPYGYTISLLFFLVPSLSIVFWFMKQTRLMISRVSFGWTVGLLFPIGGGLDFFFAHTFFVFPNKAATLGILAPAFGGGVPIEEYGFYFSGFVTVVLVYIWLDEYWLAAYTVAVDDAARITFQRLLRFHPESLALAALFIGSALLYEKLVVRAPGHFPGYFVFLVLFALLPSAALLPTARPVINWRALSLTMFMLLNTSLLWEVTLALPFGWWNFQDDAMLGIRISAWSRLPIEEVFVWIAVTYSSIIVYEIVKRWKASGRSARHAFIGQRSTVASQPE